MPIPPIVITLAVRLAIAVAANLIGRRLSGR
jgi:hypothetical protein